MHALPVPEFIDPVFTKTSPKRSFSLNRKRAFWLVFTKTGSIIPGIGLCTLNIFEYEISLSCGKFRNHHREPLFGHGNTFDRGRPVVYIIETSRVLCLTSVVAEQFFPDFPPTATFAPYTASC